MLNRPIVVIIGAHIPPVMNHRRLFLYLLRVMDPIVVGDYVRNLFFFLTRQKVLVYVHTSTSYDNHPGFSWLKKCYGLFRRGYHPFFQNFADRFQLQKKSKTIVHRRANIPYQEHFQAVSGL